MEKLAQKKNKSVDNFIETVLADATNLYEPNKEKKKAIEDFAVRAPKFKAIQRR